MREVYAEEIDCNTPPDVIKMTKDILWIELIGCFIIGVIGMCGIKLVNKCKLRFSGINPEP